MLNQEENKRYARHIMLPEIGMEGQLLLKNAKVLIVGAGGLGAPLIQYLSAAGVGTIGIVDFDVVEASNLQRQVLFSIADIGKHKGVVAKEKIESQNPHIQVNVYLEKFTSKNALDIAKNYDIIADGTDNFPTRYLVNDTCVLLGIPNVYASIFKFEGQVTVFNLKLSEEKYSPNYRDLYPTPPAFGTVPSCGEVGVLGVLPGIIGSIQANEVIKVILKKEGVLHSKLLHLDTQTMHQMILEYEDTGARNSIHQLIDYDFFCGVPNTFETIGNNEAQELSNSNKNLQIIDVRTKAEHLAGNKGGINIPLDEIETRLAEIKSNELILYCKSGARARKAGLILQNEERKIWIWE